MNKFCFTLRSLVLESTLISQLPLTSHVSEPIFPSSAPNYDEIDGYFRRIGVCTLWCDVVLLIYWTSFSDGSITSSRFHATSSSFVGLICSSPPGQNASGCLSNSGTWNHRLSAIISDPMFHFLASSAAFSLVGTFLHSLTSVIDRISPIQESGHIHDTAADRPESMRERIWIRPQNTLRYWKSEHWYYFAEQTGPKNHSLKFYYQFPDKFNPLLPLHLDLFGDWFIPSYTSRPYFLYHDVTMHQKERYYPYRIKEAYDGARDFVSWDHEFHWELVEGFFVGTPWKWRHLLTVRHLLHAKYRFHSLRKCSSPLRVIPHQPPSAWISSTCRPILTVSSIVPKLSI